MHNSLKPLTAAAVTNHLVGKKVICLLAGTKVTCLSGPDTLTCVELEQGEMHTVQSVIPGNDRIRLVGVPGIWPISRFALAPNQSGPVTKGLKPLTATAVSDDLVGKKVICLSSPTSTFMWTEVEQGTVLTVESVAPGNNCIRLAEAAGTWHIGHFALAPNQSEPEPDVEELKPLTAAAVTNHLVGKKVICLNGHNALTCVELERGVAYTVKSIAPERDRETIRLAGVEGIWHISRFALAPDQSEPEPAWEIDISAHTIALPATSDVLEARMTRHDWAATDQRSAGPFWKTPVLHYSDQYRDSFALAAGSPSEQPPVETTHSMQLKFPDGELVDIPAPEGDGWAKEILWDEWTEPSGKRATGAVSALFDSMNKQEEAATCAGIFIGHLEYSVRSTTSKIIVKEHRRRIRNEKPLIVSCFRWTRTIPEPIEPERYDAHRDYPLLLGEE